MTNKSARALAKDIIRLNSSLLIDSDNPDTRYMNLRSDIKDLAFIVQYILNVIPKSGDEVNE